MNSELEYIMNQLHGKIPKGTASNVPQGQIEKFLSEQLGSGRDWMNKNIGIPFVDTGIGAGDAFIAQSPEMFHDASWGAPYTKPTGHGGKLDARVGDILGLPLPYAGAGKAAQIGGKAGINQLMKHLSPDAKKARVAERRLNDMFASPQGVDRRVATDRRLEGMPQDQSKRQFSKLGIGTALLGGATMTPKIFKNIMDLTPEVARTAAPAAARGMGMMTTSEIPKLGHFLMQSAKPALMVKTLKEGGPDALSKKLKEVDGLHIDFPDYEDWKHNVDLDELAEYVDDPDYMRMNYASPEELLGPGDIEDDFLFDLLIDPNEPVGITDYLAGNAEYGFDPVQVVDNLEEIAKEWGTKIPDLDKYLKMAKDDPENLRKMINRKMSTGGIFDKLGKDEFGRTTMDGQSFLLEPSFM